MIIGIVIIAATTAAMIMIMMMIVMSKKKTHTYTHTYSDTHMMHIGTHAHNLHNHICAHKHSQTCIQCKQVHKDPVN